MRGASVAAGQGGWVCGCAAGTLLPVVAELRPALARANLAIYALYRPLQPFRKPALAEPRPVSHKKLPYTALHFWRCGAHHEVGHVHLVEGGEHGVRVLRLLQPVRHALAQPRHGHAPLPLRTGCRCRRRRRRCYVRRCNYRFSLRVSIPKSNGVGLIKPLHLCLAFKS